MSPQIFPSLIDFGLNCKAKPPLTSLQQEGQTFKGTVGGFAANLLRFLHQFLRQ